MLVTQDWLFRRQKIAVEQHQTLKRFWLVSYIFPIALWIGAIYAPPRSSEMLNIWGFILLALVNLQFGIQYRRSRSRLKLIEDIIARGPKEETQNG